jgi:acyl-CoA synthetase (AMP-forming)/AMP-acid ligase II
VFWSLLLLLLLSLPGDVASIDRFGYMRIQDRSKDVVKSGGEWISSIALENAAMGHPKVRVLHSRSRVLAVTFQVYCTAVLAAVA